jgi:predicted SprT family Zn-dependent metalloprotease
LTQSLTEVRESDVTERPETEHSETVERPKRGDSRAERARERMTLTTELEVALIRELRAEFQMLNASFFKRALRMPALVLSDSETRLGRYVADDRTLEISRRVVLNEPWGTVVEVLKHEMAHQYVFEVLRVENETAHGPAFRHVCERLVIDPRATGTPVTGSTRSSEEQRILERIAKLLALAESDSENEAQSAMNAAQRLMLKYNLESVATRRSPEGYAYKHLGKPSGRITEAERMIAVILGEHFFVDVIWVPVYRPLEAKRGSILEVCGTPANLEMATYVHAFLSDAGERLWREHQSQTSTTSNRDRRTYLAGVMSGFYAKLNSERAAQRKEGLVWVGDADLRTYYRKRHPHIVNARFAGSARNEAHALGRQAGHKLVLHRPVRGGTSGKTLLLKG